MSDLYKIYASQDYVDQKVSDLVNSAPETLDTLGELATAMQENESVIEALNSAITNKQDTITGAASSIVSNNLTANRILVSNSSGKVAASAYTTSDISNASSQASTALSTANSAELLAHLARPGILKWDGAIGSRDYVVIDSNNYYIGAYVHVYDDDLLSQLIAMGQSSQINIAETDYESGSWATENVDIYSSDDGMIYSEYFVYVPEDNFVVPDSSIVFPKRGIYFYTDNFLPTGQDMSMYYTSAMEIEGYVFKDSGSAVGFETYTETETRGIGDTITWDGSKDGYDGFFFGGDGNLARVAKNAPSYDELISSGGTIEVDVGGTISSFPLDTNSIIQLSDDVYAIAAGNFPLALITYVDNTVFLNTILIKKAGVYFVEFYDNDSTVRTVSLNVPGYNFIREKIVEERLVLKEKCLPPSVFDVGNTNTIEWDGVIGDRITTGSTLENGVSLYAVYMSNYVPNLDNLSQDIISLHADYNGSPVELNPFAYELVDGLYALFDNMIGSFPLAVFTTRDDISITYTDGNDYLFPKAGVYFSKSIYDGETLFVTKSITAASIEAPIVKIKKSALPDDIGGGIGEETDPTVPAWAKQPNKPSYTAAEVGALSVDTKIPTVPTNVSAFSNDAGYLTQVPSEYITETELNAKGYITGYTETDPTVPAWAKAASKPSYTASEVGADAAGTASSAVSSHNTSTAAHNDIRELISGLTTKLNTLANSDDTTLDQMSEVVAYIKNNKSLIDGITTSKVNVADIINNLTTNVSNKPLSAAQGVAIKGLIDALQTEVNGKATSSALTSHTGSTSNPHKVTAAQVGADPSGTASTAVSNHNSSTTAHSDIRTEVGKKANASDLTSHTGNTSNPHNVTKAQVGLGNVENKSSATIRGELTKTDVTTALGYTPPTQDTTYTLGSFGITATAAELNYVDGVTSNVQTQLGNKVDKVSGKGLSTNDFTAAYKSKLDGIAAGANAYTLPVAGSAIGGVKSGGDITVASDGAVSVNDDSHNHVISNVDGLQSALDSKVPTSRAVNGKALTTDISLAASDVGADASGSAAQALTDAKAYVDGQPFVKEGRLAGSTVGESSVAVNIDTTASGKGAFAEGNKTVASGWFSHAEGFETVASSDYDHAEGYRTKAASLLGGDHAEGNQTQATSLLGGAHAEGMSTTAAGASGTHAEGFGTYAGGISGTHAEGMYARAEGDCSHAEGYSTIAGSKYQHVQGKYNIVDTDDVYAHIVGNGTADTEEIGPGEYETVELRSNAHTIDWYGNAWFKGKIRIGGDGQNSDKAKLIATQEYVNTYVDTQLDNLDIDEKIAALVDSAPGTLDTLNELAAALGDDPNFATTVSNQIGTKANVSDLTSHTGNKSNPHGVTAAQVGLGNVENKSSATIRGELTKANVTTALGYTPPSSVNGKTGAVSLTYSDVGAQPSGSYVTTNNEGVQSIIGGLVLGGTSATATAKGRLMITGHTNPLIGLQALDGSGNQLTPYYFQVSNDVMYIGPTSTKALAFDRDGNATIPATLTVSGTITEGGTALSSKYAAYSHNQAASTISAGTFAGQVVANSSGQTPGTSLLRNSKLVNTETNPTVNGEIVWNYE